MPPDRCALSEFTAYGLFVRGTFEKLFSVVPDAWKRLFSILHSNDMENLNALEISLGSADGIYTEFLGVSADHASHRPTELTEYRIPAAEYYHLNHNGPLSAIPESYAVLYEFARQEGVRCDQLKIDSGYHAHASLPHDLYIRIAGQASQR